MKIYDRRATFHTFLVSLHQTQRVTDKSCAVFGANLSILAGHSLPVHSSNVVIEIVIK